MSILAGVMIGLGCILYLQIGGLAGACMFSIGLMSVILFKFKLFTGKAGLLTTCAITPLELIKIWFGNLLGICLLCLIISVSPFNDIIAGKCMIIMEAREAAGFIPSLLLAIPCGMLMYMAGSVPENPLQLLYVGMCVAAFIMGGFYHCVADMFYTIQGALTIHQFVNIIFITIGNIIGCNIIPLVQKIKGEQS